MILTALVILTNWRTCQYSRPYNRSDTNNISDINTIGNTNNIDDINSTGDMTSTGDFNNINDTNSNCSKLLVILTLLVTVMVNRFQQILIVCN